MSTLSRDRRPALIAALALLSALVLLVQALPAGGHYPQLPARPCPGGGDAVQRKGAWETIKKPAQLDQIATHAAGGPDGVNLLVSDGRKVMRSSDGGCSWQSSFDVQTADLPGTPADDAVPHVAELTFPDAGGRAFMLVDGVGRAGASQLMVSDDAGKTWKSSGSGLPAAGGFRDLVAAPSDAKQLYMTVAYNDTAADHDPSAGVPLPPDAQVPNVTVPTGAGVAPGVTGALYSSSDGGASWKQASSGAQIERLAVDPLAPQKLWAVRSTHTVERSDDGGKSWLAVTIKTHDDDDPTQYGAVDSSWRYVAVAHPPGGLPAAVLLAASPDRVSDASRVVASIDGGHTFVELPAENLGPIAGVMFGNSPAQVLFAAGSTSSAFRGPGLSALELSDQHWRDIDDLELVSLREPLAVQLEPATRGHSGLHAIEFRRDAPGAEGSPPDLIARYTPPDPPPTPSLLNKRRCSKPGTPLAPAASSSPQAAGADHGPVTFAPGDFTLRLQPGVASRLPLKAAVGEVPNPLDVYFLIDQTNSMDAAIEGVLCSAGRLARDLVDKGIDAWFGLGVYGDEYEYIYRRFLDVSPPDKLEPALQKVFTLRGLQEAIRSALYQTATGAGLEYSDGNGRRSIPPGQQADYRDDALRTVLVIGDEPYDNTTPAEPTREEVVAALRKRGILAIGVQVLPPRFEVPTEDPQRNILNQQLLHQQLSYFAAQTGAVAPPGGVDCDGGGSPDIQAGAPIVCQVDEFGIQQTMGDTLVTMLRNLKDLGDLKLVPLKRSGLAVSVEGGQLLGANLKHHNDLTGTGIVSCSTDQAGRSYAITFAVIVGKRVIGTIAGTARCGDRVPAATAPAQPRAPAKAPPAHPKPAPTVVPVGAPPAAPHPAIAIAPPPPPPAPAPVSPLPVSAPASAPAAAPSAAAAPAPGQAGLASEPQRVALPQAALIKPDQPGPAPEHAIDRSGPRAGQHFITAARRRSTVPEPAIITLGTGFAIALCWGAVLAGQARTRRRDVVPARARTRR